MEESAAKVQVEPKVNTES